jgi:2-keto-4-pentenoate hydratase/2-oxohepta-3-ene-1,7-dioic acid hydratase in catechol pathway
MLAGDAHIVEYAGDFFDAPRPTGRSMARDAVVLLAPCVPSKVVALWNNYHALGAKLGKAAPQHPLFFLKPGTSVVGPEAPIRRPSGYAGKIVFEGELGVVVGRRAHEVSLDAAHEYIRGYTCINDVTAVDILGENPDFPQWCRAKSFDTFGCMGPAIAADLDWAAARVVTRLDGVERQNYPLSDMIMPPVELVSRLSRDMTLLPGDVIACGTSLGAGSMKDGSVIEVTIDGIGTLRNALP